VPGIGGTLICWGVLGRWYKSGWGGEWVAGGIRMDAVYGSYDGRAEICSIAGLAGFLWQGVQGVGIFEG